MTLRAAVIGAGAMGRHHARVYAGLDDVELVGVADPSVESRTWIERRFRIPTYEDHRTLLSRERPDLVSIVVPTGQHTAVALEVIAAGVSLLVEKPIAATEAEAQVMIDAARVADVVLTVGHVERFNPAVRELKRRVDAGEIGRVFTVQARRLGPFPNRVRDVGVVIDLATHDLDILRWIVGTEVVRIQAETAQQIHTAHEDLLVGLLRFEDGEIGLLNINWLTPTKIRELSVTGERGMFVADYLRQTLTFHENTAADAHWESFGQLQGVVEGNTTSIRIEGGEPLVAELAAFAAAVRDGTPPIVSGEDGLAALRLARAVVAAGERGATW